MKKLLIAATLILSSLCTNAQGLKFSIQPHEVKDTASHLYIGVTSFVKDSVIISYALTTTKDKVIETGTRTVPIQALAIISARPIDIDVLNGVLATWNLEAIKQEEN